MKKKTITKNLLVALATLLATVTLLFIGMPATAAEETLPYTNELGELTGAVSSLSLVVAGLLTAVVFPLFCTLL